MTVAAQACMLLLRRETPCYERLRLIQIYPGTEFAETSQSTLLGECSQRGIVSLAWDSVRSDAVNPTDGANVTLHEFAHVLDGEDGQFDGIPLVTRNMNATDAPGAQTAWAQMLSHEFERFRDALNKGVEISIDSYGATDPAEFFAVATEYFFEKPQLLQAKQPELYAALKSFYQQDPAEWQSGRA